MATLKDYRDERLRKLDELRQLGINPYPAHTNRTHSLGYIVGNFEDMKGQDVTVVGQVKSIRKFGKLAFVVIRDWSGSLQMFWRANEDAPEPDRTQGELTLK